MEKKPILGLTFKLARLIWIGPGNQQHTGLIYLLYLLTSHCISYVSKIGYKRFIFAGSKVTFLINS